MFKKVELKDILLISHKNCKDGVGSVLAILHSLGIEDIDNPPIEILRVQYGDPIPSVSGKHVIITDFSYSKDTLLQMQEEAKSIYVIDHHTTAKDELKGLDFCTFDMSKSGAVLTWEAYNDKPVPILLQYIQDRDLWTWELPNSKEVSAALLLIPDTDYCEHMKYLHNIDGLVKDGQTILKYQQQTIDKIKSKSDLLPIVDIGGVLMPMVNSTTLISEIGNMLSNKYTCACMYFDVVEDGVCKRVFSLRSNGSVDVANIAKSYGGGGHKAAAGFSTPLSNIWLDKLYTNNKLVTYNES